MHLFTRVTFGASMFAAGLLGGLALFEALAGETETVTVTISADPAPPPPAPTCDASWMPPGYAMPLPAARTAELQKSINMWIEGSGARGAPDIDALRGIVVARNEDEDAQSTRVCGVDSSWMRYAVHDGLRNAQVVCCDNICELGGGEAPKEWLVFSPRDTGWTLDAWIQSHGEHYRPLAAGLAELAGGTCSGR